MMILTKRLARGRLYYGWYIVATAFVSQAMSYGLQTYTFGIFLGPMNDDLGWSRGELSGVQSFSTLVNGILAPFIGPFIDKRGGRELMVIGAIVTGIGLSAVSQVQELWQFYLARGVVVTVGMLFIGNLVVNVAVSNWFVKQRGRAVAIGAMGISMAGILLPPLTQAIISAHGWRAAWAAFGMLVILLVTPFGGLLMCRRPEDIGLLPDGAGNPAPVSGQNAKENQTAQRVGREEHRWGRRQAMRTASLWLIIVAFALASMGLMAMLLHLYPFLTDKGFAPRTAAMGLSLIGIAGLICKPIWGLIIERVPARYCAAAEFVLCASGIVLILMATSIMAVYAAILLFGVGVGGVMIVQEVVWADYFGRLTLGAIRSIGVPISIVTSAGGPAFAGVAFDISHSYQFAFSAFIVTYILAMVLILLSRRPVPPSPKELITYGLKEEVQS